MGMLDAPQGMPPQPAPDQAGMMGDEQQGDNYNGQVVVDGQPVQVRNGAAEVGGQPFFVSPGGELVIDKQQRPVGYVENGTFMPMNQQHADKLKQMGVLQ